MDDLLIILDHPDSTESMLPEQVRSYKRRILAAMSQLERMAGVLRDGKCRHGVPDGCKSCLTCDVPWELVGNNLPAPLWRRMESLGLI